MNSGTVGDMTIKVCVGKVEVHCSIIAAGKTCADEDRRVWWFFGNKKCLNCRYNQNKRKKTSYYQPTSKPWWKIKLYPPRYEKLNKEKVKQKGG